MYILSWVFCKEPHLIPIGEKAMRPMPQAPTLGYEKFKPLKPTILKREKEEKLKRAL
jgi:hypothetical protein